MKLTAVILCMALLFSGCSQYNATELSNRLIIEAIGIDTADSGFKITVLALNTLQTGSANSTETPDGISKVFSAEGTSIADAFAHIDLISGQVPLYSQTRVLILGKELAQNAPIQALNYFITGYTTRDDILTAVSATTASHLITTDLGENLLTSKVIQNILQSGKFNGQTVSVPLYKFINQLLHETDAAYLPILQSDRNDEGEQEISHAGIAVFPKDNYTVTLDKDRASGLYWAAALLKNSLLQVKLGQDNVSLSVQKSKTKIKMNDGQIPTFTLNVSVFCEVIEVNKKSNDAIDLSNVAQIKKAAETKIKKDIETFIQKTMRENACDCLSLGRRIENKKPSYYNEIKENYSDFLENIDISVYTEVNILRTGRQVLQTN